MKPIYALLVKVKVVMDVTVIGQYYRKWPPVASDIYTIPQFNQSLRAIPTLTGLAKAKLHRNDVMLSPAYIYL